MSPSGLCLSVERKSQEIRQSVLVPLPSEYLRPQRTGLGWASPPPPGYDAHPFDPIRRDRDYRCRIQGRQRPYGTDCVAMLEKVYNWVDERINLKGLQAKLLNEPMPGGARYAYTFGSALLFIFILQVATGILLMFYYAPTADHAYASTQYILKELEYGWFILSFHFWGSSVMVIMVVIHMSQVFIWGAHKKPREMVWL